KALRWLAQHQGRALAGADDFIALVVATMGEHDDAGVGTRFAFAHFDDFALDMNRIAVKHRLGKAHLVPAQIGDRGAQGGVADGEAHDQAQRERAVDDALLELGVLAAVLLVQMQRRGIHRQRAEEYVVGLGDRPANGVRETVPYGQLLEIDAWHAVSLWVPVLPRSLRLDAGVLDPLAPIGQLRTDELAQLLGIAGHHFRRELRDLLLDLGFGQRLPHLDAQLVDDLLRRSRRREHGDPRGDVEAREARGFGNCRQVRHQRRALLARDADRAELARPDERLVGCHVGDALSN